MANEFSIGSPTGPEQPFDVGLPATGTYPLSSTVAAERAFKASVGLPAFPMDTSQITDSILSGQEDTIRKASAAHVDMVKSQYRQKIISSVARETGGPLDERTTAYVKSLINEPGTDHKSVWEESYAREFMSNVKRTGDMYGQNWWRDTPEEVKNAYLGAGTEFETKRQLLLTEIQNTNATLQDQSYIGYAADFLKGIVPFYGEAKKRGNVPGVGGLYPLGTNIKEQASNLFAMPMDQFKKTLDGMKPLRQDNPQLHKAFLEELLGQSTSEEMLNNIFTGVDLTFVKPLAVVGAAKWAKNALTARNAFKTAVKAAEEPATKATMAEAAGDITEAAVQEAAAKAVARTRGYVDPVQDAVDSLKDVFKAGVTSLRSGTGNFRQELINRLEERSTELSAKLIETLQTTSRVDRISSVIKVEEAIRGVIKEMGESYPGMNNRLLNISVPRKENISNTYFVDFFLGDDAGKLFGNIRDAETFASQHGLVGAVVSNETQLGTRFSIKVTKSLRETDNVMRDALIATSEAKAPESWTSAWKSFFQGARTPEEVLALEHNMNRKVATFAPSRLFQIAKETASEIRELKGWNLPFTQGRKKWDDWVKVMDEAKRIRDDATGNPRMFNNPVELSDMYQRILQRTPDEQEVAAAFAYKRQQETLKVLEMIGSYRNKARVGGETITVRAVDEKTVFGKPNAQWSPRKLATFDAIPLNGFPAGEHSFAIITDAVGKERVKNTATFLGKQRSWLVDGIKRGEWKVYQVIDDDARPLQGYGTIKDERIKYVVVKNGAVEQRPLSWNQARAGAPEYDYDHYVKQAIMKIDNTTKFRWYEGDANIAAFNIRAIGKDFAEKLDKMRLLIKDGKIDEAKAISVGKDFDEVHSWFKDSLTPDGKTIPARLNLEEPIRVVPRNRTIGQLDNSMRERHNAITEGSFRDGTIEGYGKRFNNKPDPYDIFSLRNEATAANPLYKVEPVKYLDPITSINRSLTKAINSTWMDDYKIYSVENWFSQAADLLMLDIAPGSRARVNPMYHFFHGTFQRGVDAAAVNNLEAQRFQIKQFLGIENKTNTWLHDVAQKLADTVYNKIGPSAAMVPAWALPKLRDPFSFMRSVTFHAKLGLFSVPQLMVQMQTYATILGVAGIQHAAPGAKAALLQHYALINSTPELLEHFDKLATKQIIPGTTRWRPGWWKESYKALESTGFGNVAGEHILRDNTTYDFISSKAKTFLDWGTFFFREGERQVRYGAWHTAYLEFKTANPVGRLTEDNIKSILQRADLLSVNMSRASASTLHQGVFSIPTQFLSYQLRLGELFTGKRLTDLERGRLMATYSLLYGIPGAYGLSGLPVGDYVQKWQREDGYQVGKNWAMTAINEGIPSLMLGVATGKYYNVPERYGAQGFEQLRDALRGDKAMWDVIGGAAYSTFSNTLARSDGFFSAMASMWRDDSKHFSLKTEDFVDLFKEISSVNNGWRALMATQYGRWLTKKEGYLTDASTGQAAFMFLTGLQPQASTDLNLMAWTRADEKKLIQHAEDQFTREYRRGLRAMDNNNPDQASSYFTRAKAYLRISGYPEEEYAKIFARAAQDQESIIDRIKWDYYTQKVPGPRRESAFEGLPSALRKN